MKFTLREIANPQTIIELAGTEDNELDGPDSCAAALHALEAMGLMLVRVDDPKLTTIQVETLPDGRMTEENAAKYLGYSLKQLQMFRLRSKSMRHGNQQTKKAPRYCKKMGKIFYRRPDLDAWLRSGWSDRVVSVPPSKVKEILERARRREEKALTVAKQGDTVSP